MITYKELGNNGRLGNVLWQYAFLKAVSIKTGYEIKLPDFGSRVWHGQKCELVHFDVNYKHLSSREKTKNSFKEKNINQYDPDVFKISDNTDFYGFFQNLRYFEGIEEEIKNEMQLKEHLRMFGSSYIQKLKNKYDKEVEVVSIHIRRGDLLTALPDGYENFYEKGGDYLNYLEEAMKNFESDNYVFLVFTGGWHDNNGKSDMDWCKENITGKNIVYSENKSSIQDFALISNCDHNILSHASSYGWWAAYINNSPNKKIVAPRNYHIEKRENFKEGELYPKDYILL